MQFVTSPSLTSVGHRAVWANGTLYDLRADARVVATDHGLVAGDGVFEVMKVTDEGPFAVQRHLDRLSRSASALGLPPPDHERIRTAVDAVLDGQVMSRGRLRITYTGGPGPLSSDPAYGPPTLVVAVEPTDVPLASTAIVTAPWTRNEHGALSGVKSTSYAENVRGLAYASSRAATEAIFPNTADNVCEGTGTNIFMVFGGRVMTPPLSAGPLAGITREVILEWCEVEERDVTLAKARAADEVFLTSSLRDVQAVHRWDEINYSQSHPVTDQVAETFARKSLGNLDP
jgi:branched-chain amino acid aminotransferase